MNLAEVSVTLRQRSVLEIFDLACRFVVDLEPRLYLRLTAALLLPSLLICAALRWGLGASWPIVWLVAIGLGTLVQSAFTVAAGELMFARQVRAGAVLRRSFRRLISYAGMLVVSRVLIVLSLPMAPFTWMRLFFVHEALLLENASEIEALRRSSRFVRYHAKNTLEVLAVSVSTVAVCVLVGEYLGQGLVRELFQSGEPVGSLYSGGSLYALAGYFASVPFVTAARFLAYVDARTRADGWDIQVRFMAIEAADRERAA